MKDLEKALDRALDGKERAAVEVDTLMQVGDKVSRAVKVEAPDSERERAIFVRAVGTRRRSVWRQAFVPAISAAAALVVVVLYAGFFAQPGSALYPVRQALDEVGITQSSGREIEQVLLSAERDLVGANADLSVDDERVADLAVSAIEKVGRARALLADYDGSDRDELLDRAQRAEDKALSLIQFSTGDDERSDDNSGSDGGNDNSGRGGDDDNSGSGGGNEDNSGSGGDDSGSGSGGDDSSGSGGGDDSSGSGGGDDGSGTGGGDDSSGTGGGGDDNSGPGSGDDNLGSGSGD